MYVSTKINCDSCSNDSSTTIYLEPNKTENGWQSTKKNCDTCSNDSTTTIYLESNKTENGRKYLKVKNAFSSIQGRVKASASSSQRLIQRNLSTNEKDQIFRELTWDIVKEY